MREVYVPRLIARPLRWLMRPIYGGALIDAVTVAYTVFYFTATPSEDLKRHEQEHVNQARRMGLLRYWWAYSREYLRVGYWNSRFEREARRAAGQE